MGNIPIPVIQRTDVCEVKSESNQPRHIYLSLAVELSNNFTPDLLDCRSHNTRRMFQFDPRDTATNVRTSRRAVMQLNLNCLPATTISRALVAGEEAGDQSTPL